MILNTKAKNSNQFFVRSMLKEITEDGSILANFRKVMSTDSPRRNHLINFLTSEDAENHDISMPTEMWAFLRNVVNESFKGLAVTSEIYLARQKDLVREKEGWWEYQIKIIATTPYFYHNPKDWTRECQTLQIFLTFHLLHPTKSKSGTFKKLMKGTLSKVFGTS